jgi:DNA repair exonuclease SbcCD ATPase subunit
MGIQTNTRTLTREAAQKLHSEGMEPHKITVDRIYALIGQGSRTTINDELKRWRAAHQKGLFPQTDGIPSELVEAFSGLWQAARDQANTAFHSWKITAEEELSQTLEKLDLQSEALRNEQARNEALRLQSTQAQAETLRWQQALEQETRHAQETQQALEQALAQQRVFEKEAREREEALRKTLETARQDWDAQTRIQTIEHREALALATERLEGVQKHMLEQISVARDETRLFQGELARQKAATQAVLDEKRQLERENDSLTQEAKAQHAQWQERLHGLEARLAALSSEGVGRALNARNRIPKKHLRKPVLGRTQRRFPPLTEP